jgi:hypothetical protein
VEFFFYSTSLNLVNRAEKAECGDNVAALWPLHNPIHKLSLASLGRPSAHCRYPLLVLPSDVANTVPALRAALIKEFAREFSDGTSIFLQGLIMNLCQHRTELVTLDT